MSKIIFHIDINAFFASVEEIYNPKFKVIPIGICGINKKAVLSTCNYAARQYGVEAAMTANKAKELCPHIVFVEPKMWLYEEVSKYFIDFIKTVYTDKIEIGSIDECYMDVTEIVHKFHDNPLILATQMQNDILQKLNLPVSIGISDSKFLAKIASELKKPLGISTLYKSEIDEKFLPLKIESYIGIGKKKIPILNQMGIYTIRDLKMSQHQDKLKQLFGKKYFEIINVMSAKLHDNEVCEDQTTKAISKANTLLKPEIDLERIIHELNKVSKKVIHELNKHFLVGQCLTLILKTSQKLVLSKSRTVKYFINEKNLFDLAKDLFFELWDECSEIKYIAIGVKKLQTL